MSHTEPRLEGAIRATLAPRLREDGFAGSARTFRRVVGDCIQVVNVQGSRHGGSFAINLGLHPTGIPDVLGHPVDPKTLSEPSCEFRRRLAAHGQDQWWSHGPTEDSMLAAGQAASEVYVAHGRPILASFAGPDCLLANATAEHFRAGTHNLAGFRSTLVRMARALALLRVQEGRPVEARAFARLALEHEGSASALHDELLRLAA